VLTNTSVGADFTDANTTGVDTRGANPFIPDIPLTTANLIQPNGHVSGADLPAGHELFIRDYDGSGKVPPRMSRAIFSLSSLSSFFFPP
jgi:hypothetical protein